MLLGIVLPLVFLTCVEKYSYYLRPVELIPTYGTAWLFLAFPVALLSLLLRITVRWTAVPLWIVGTSLAGTLVSAAVIWLQTFGLSARSAGFNEITLFLISIGAGLVICGSAPGRSLLRKLYPLAKYGTGLGALCLLSLPWSRWQQDPPVASPIVAVAADKSLFRPNLVLVTVDTLSAEHMSLYGATRPTTPGLESFARAATTFERAYANANFTTSGISSILTGTRPWTHRAVQQPSAPLDGVRGTSLPALLRHAGYQTAYVSTSAFAGASKNGLGVYFEVHRDDRIAWPSICLDRLSAILPYDCAAAELPLFRVADAVGRRVRQALLRERTNRDYDPDIASRSALDWLAAADKRRPTFLWIHFLPPHDPYAAPQPWLGRFDPSPAARTTVDSEPLPLFAFGFLPKERVQVLEARYDESVAYSDYYITRFAERALQLLGDNTAVVITADHGESFEHGYGMHTGPGLFEPLIHIPLIVRFPAQRDGVRAPVTAEQVDIAPTLAELAGVPSPTGWEGHSLVSYRSPAASVDEATWTPAFAMNFEENPRRGAITTGSIAVIDGHWKLVHYMGALHYPQMPPLHDALYDLSQDPGELVNRIVERPGEAGRLRRLISEQLDRHGRALP